MLNKIEIAKSLVRIGLLPIPCRDKKDSFIKWREPSLSTIDDNYYRVFDDPKCQNIAIVAGPKSGGLMCIDVDVKYDLEGDLYKNLIDNIISYSYDLFKKLVIAKTPSGGYHLIYRTPLTSGNMKLARRPSTDEEWNELCAEYARNGKQPPKARQPKVLIETRGDGGYFLGWPSPGYVFEQGAWAEIQKISEDDAKALLDICVSMDKMKLPEEDTAVETALRSNKKATSKYAITPWDDYNAKSDLLSLMISNGWSVFKTLPSSEDGRPVTYLKRPGKTDKEMSATFNHVPGKVFCFTTSTVLPSEKPLSAFECFMHLECNSNISVAVKALEEQGYGVRLDRDVFNGDLSKLQPSLGPRVEHKDNTTRMLEANGQLVRGVEMEIWWDVHVKVSKEGYVNKDVKISQSKLCAWLGDNGFRTKLVGEEMDYIKIDGIIVERVVKSDLFNFAIRFVEGLPDAFDYIDRPTLKEALFKGSEAFFSDLKLSSMPRFDESLLMRDTVKESYIPFKNGVLRIDDTTERIIEYSKFNKYIWKENIKNFNYKTPLDAQMDSHPFSIFLYNISGRDKDRYKNLLKLIGYCLSNYKNPAQPAAVVLCDSKLSDRSEGGTGKGLLVKSMSYIRKTVYEDGKSANRRNQSEFRFSRIDHSTEILHISDVEKNYDFEAMFSIITEGIPVNKKFRAEEYIAYEQSPKIIISTNYSIKGRGASHNRRRIEFELADYYNDRKTPEQEFKHNFFTDWNEELWNIFYGLMSRSIRMYIALGIPEFNGINIDLRKFKDETSPDFVTWFTNFFGAKEQIQLSGIPDVFASGIQFESIYSSYLTFAGLERYETKPARFLKNMHSGCSYVGIELEETSKQLYNSKNFERWLKVKDPSKDSRVKVAEEQLRKKIMS